MSFYSNNSTTADSRSYGAIDLSAIMRQVYVWMAIGLAVCFGVAWVIGQQYIALINNPVAARSSILLNPVFMIGSLVAYLILAFTINPIIMRANISLAIVGYLVFTAIFGLFISSIFAVYELGTIATAFVATAGMFGAMSIWGYTTKADLSKFGNILIMALIGLIIASIVNIFANSQMIEWLISYAGVVIFAGFVAYNTNWIKNTAVQVANSGDTMMAQRVALLGALHLFTNFVNLFMFILRIMGGSSRRS
ncbi:MAG: Bax inhibitor-1/YccA family protein [Anaerolineae bacterium]|nr:Bax inhibitor-1/YccA family protein [Anaerolineae bacterium]